MKCQSVEFGLLKYEEPREHHSCDNEAVSELELKRDGEVLMIAHLCEGCLNEVLMLLIAKAPRVKEV